MKSRLKSSSIGTLTVAGLATLGIGPVASGVPAIAAASEPITLVHVATFTMSSHDYVLTAWVESWESSSAQAMDSGERKQSCYPDCDQSTGQGVLDIFDFLCFGNKFAANDPYACDCDLSTGLEVCDIFDFLCFGNAFQAGCP